MMRKVVVASPVFKGELEERYVDLGPAKPVAHSWHLGQRPGSKAPPNSSGERQT